MADRADPFARGDPRRRAERDRGRRKRRASPLDFWRWVALVGSVGWPIALLGVGGAIGGRYLDLRFGTGIRFTLIALTLGVTMGTVAAFRAVRGDG